MVIWSVMGERCILKNPISPSDPFTEYVLLLVVKKYLDTGYSV